VSGLSPAEQFELLRGVGDIADGALPLVETVDRLLDMIVPRFADTATLDAVSPGGELTRLGARAAGDRKAELEAAILRRKRVADADVGIAHALTTGGGQVLSPLTDEHLRAIAGSDEDLELLRSIGMRSALFVPLRARGRIVGALGCATASSGRTLDEDDLRFAEVLAGRIALALDNAGLSASVSDLEGQLQATLANLAEAVLVRAADGQMVFANPAAAELLGATSVEDVERASSQELMGLYDAYDESGRSLTLADLPSARALRGERPEPLLVRNVVRATGEERWLLHKATPVLDADGATSLVVNVIEDVTEVKRAELAQRLLAEAGRALSSSLDYEQTLQLVAQLAVPELADWCGVSMRTDGDLLQSVAVAHVDPAKVEIARRFGERFPARMSDRTGTAEVIRTGQPQLVPLITDELIAEAGSTPEQIELLRELEMRSVIIVPLAVAGGPAIGALTLVMAESGRLFDEDDLVLAEELARRAATAVENARLYTERSRIADTLQRSLLPPELPDVPGFALASLYRAAGEHNDVGGDFYDVFPVGDGWLIVVGDVAGRGAEAAALTSLSRYTLRTAAKLLGDPIAAMEELNAALRERPVLSLVGLCCVALRQQGETAVASVVLAGHPPAIHVHDGQARPVGRFASFLGMDDRRDWCAADVELAEGDQLVLYTDGVTDTTGRDDRFGEERLAATLADAAGASDAVRRIELALDEFAHGPQSDDTAVLALERTVARVPAALA
jgi:PAS domain S-box-containing protein